jgi:hypothetical protein
VAAPAAAHASAKAAAMSSGNAWKIEPLLAGYQTLMAEARASGMIYALLVCPHTQEWELIDAMTMEQRQGCLACASFPDVPKAFVGIHAGENATVALYLPICDRCWRKSVHKLQARAQKIIKDLIPDVPIKFGLAQLTR